MGVAGLPRGEFLLNWNPFAQRVRGLQRNYLTVGIHQILLNLQAVEVSVLLVFLSRLLLARIVLVLHVPLLVPNVLKVNQE